MTQLNSKNEYSFDCEGEPLTRKILFITGVNRSGTTLLGNLVGSFKNVEYDFEPWVFHCIPMMAASGQINTPAAQEIFRGYFNETFTSSILGRHFNFRPTDDTRIWQRLSMDEIFNRWREVKDRTDVKKYAHKQQSTFCIKAVNFVPFLSLLWDSFPAIKFIEIIRKPLDVALSIQKKGWVNIEKLQNLEGLPIKKKVRTGPGQELFLPWWLADEDVDYFLGMNELGRALYASRVVTEMGSAEKKRLGIRGQNPRYLEVHYEDLLKNPTKFIQQIADYSGAEMTAQTEKLTQSVRTERLQQKTEFSWDSVPERERKRFVTPQYA